MKVLKTSTFYKIPNASDTCQSIINELSYLDFSENKKHMGFTHNEMTDALYVSKGVGDAFIMRHLRIGITDIIQTQTMPEKPCQRLFMKNKPKDYQALITRDIINHFQSGRNMVIMHAAAGSGKTFTATNICVTTQSKALILVSGERLGKQWVNDSYHVHTNAKKVGGVMYVSGTQKLLNLESMADGIDVLVTTHKSLGNVMAQMGPREFNQYLSKFGFGTLIFDEFDTNRDSMFRLLCNTMIPRVLFLSATPFLSSKVEDEKFQILFRDVPRVGNEHIKTSGSDRRDADCYHWKGDVTQEMLKDIMGREWKFNIARYHGTLFKDGKVCCEDLGNVLDTIVEKEIKPQLHLGKSKIVVFVGRIKGCQEFKDILVNKYNINPSEISILNSETPKAERYTAMDSNLIISISKSLGRGCDIKNIQTLINFETFSSLSILEQACGRLSRTGNKFQGHYINVVNHSLPETARMYSSIQRKLRELFVNVKDIWYFDKPKVRHSKFKKKQWSRNGRGKSTTSSDPMKRYY